MLGELVRTNVVTPKPEMFTVVCINEISNEAPSSEKIDSNDKYIGLLKLMNIRVFGINNNYNYLIKR